jgi:CheY-like chemotaxis protein
MTTVIVCESDPQVLRLACSVLKDMDCDVAPYHDGGLALKAMRTCKADLVICDCFAPTVNGIRLFSMMQDDQELNGIPYVLMCYKDMMDVGEAAGCPYLLRKPFDSDKFQKLVTAALNSRDDH